MFSGCGFAHRKNCSVFELVHIRKFSGCWFAHKKSCSGCGFAQRKKSSGNLDV